MAEIKTGAVNPFAVVGNPDAVYDASLIHPTG